MSAPAKLSASALVALLLSLAPSIATAKRHGISSPSGRTIYDRDETVFSELDHRTRRFVVEVATGLAPEGNLGMSLGWINQPLQGLEFYAGAGLEFTPSRNFTGTIRYMPTIRGYRPYVAGYFLHRRLYQLGSYSHNTGIEVGYKFVLERTYHLTLGVGLRRILHIGRSHNSILNQPRIDQAFLTEQEGSVDTWAPTLAIRFSRAF